MNPTEQVQLGKTSLRVTRLGLGGTAIAGLYHDVREEAAVQTVQRALALATNLIDTAPLYGAGKSEQRVGLSLAGVKRNSFILASKVGYGLVEQRPGANEDIFFPFENAPPLRPVMDFSYDGVMRSVEQSLRRLGLDRVDILHIHDPHNHYDEALKGAYKALDKLREEKIIVAVGVGMNQPKMLVRFAREANFDCFLLAGRFTLIDHIDAKELLSLCIENHISIILGGPYNSGILATGSTPGTTFNYLSAPPDVLEKVRQIEVVCERHSVPLKAAALQFPLTHPAVVSVIPGARSPEEVTENFQMMSYPIQEAFWDELHARNFLPQEARASS